MSLVPVADTSVPQHARCRYNAAGDARCLPTPQATKQHQDRDRENCYQREILDSCRNCVSYLIPCV
ncbi:MAG: hypothetical protein QGG09_04270 [Pirellulaceae bacterium]|nr:hypothetical protein [Pirellulaceae bacterium]